MIYIAHNIFVDLMVTYQLTTWLKDDKCVCVILYICVYYSS